MTVGLHASLSPHEGIALRRIVHGSLAAGRCQDGLQIGGSRTDSADQSGIAPDTASFDALPKAPLLAKQRSLHAMTGYVEGLIEKAQSRASVHAATTSSKTPDAAAPPPMPASVDLLLETRDEEEHRREFTTGPRFTTTSSTSNESRLAGEVHQEETSRPECSPRRRFIAQVGSVVSAPRVEPLNLLERRDEPEMLDRLRLVADGLPQTRRPVRSPIALPDRVERRRQAGQCVAPPPPL
jgi:hypothetical protein